MSWKQLQWRFAARQFERSAKKNWRTICFNEDITRNRNVGFNYKNNFRFFKIVFLCRNVIDVAALDSHNLQQHEYLDRMKQYNQRLQQLCSANGIQYKSKTCILQDVPNPEKILNSDPVNPDDVKLVSWIVFCFWW